MYIFSSLKSLETGRIYLTPVLCYLFLGYDYSTKVFYITEQ